MRFIIILLLLVGCSEESPTPIEPVSTCEQKFQEVYKFGEFVNDLNYIGVSKTEVNLHIVSVPEFVNKQGIIDFVYASPPKTYKTGEVGNLLVQQAQIQKVCQ